MTAHKYYTDEQVEYLRDIANGRTRDEITEMFNERFNDNRTMRSIGGLLSRRKIRTNMQGYKTRLNKGHTPWNKGKSVCAPGSEKGWFKKGHTDKRSPVGAERFTSEGWMEVKTAQPDIWEKKHLVVWKKSKGEIPYRHVVLFKDGDRKNCELDNLMMVHQNAMTTVGKRKAAIDDPELNHLIYKLTELEVVTNVKARELKGAE